MLRKLFTLLPAVFEALVVSVVGLGPVVVGSGLLWAVHDRFSAETLASWWRVAVRFWLLALGNPLPIAATRTSENMQIPAYSISLIPLGLTALMLWRAWWGGRRFGEDREVWPAWVGFWLGGALCGGLAAATVSGGIWAGALAGAFLPGLAFCAGTLRAGQSRERMALTGLLSRIGLREEPLGPAARRAVRAIALTLLVWLCGAALLVTIAIVSRWMSIVALSEQLHVDWLGALILAAVQLAYLPNLIVWAGHWALGTGFALGVGSTVTPFQTRLAPLPSWPVLAALPSGRSPLFWLALIIPLLAVGLGAWVLGGVLRDPFDWHGLPGWARIPVLSLVHALPVAILVWVSGVAAQGAIGPGRLSHTGPAPFASLGIAFLGTLLVSAGVLFLRSRLPRERGVRPGGDAGSD